MGLAPDQLPHRLCDLCGIVRLWRTRALACEGRRWDAFVHLPVGASQPAVIDVADGVMRPTGPPAAARLCNWFGRVAALPSAWPCGTPGRQGG
jgi:hypothetical protein